MQGAGFDGGPQCDTSAPTVEFVVIWNNAPLQHSATLTDPDDPRTLWRITVLEPTDVVTVASNRDLRQRYG